MLLTTYISKLRKELDKLINKKKKDINPKS